jgi:hypothetical protein
MKKDKYLPRCDGLNRLPKSHLVTQHNSAFILHDRQHTVSLKRSKHVEQFPEKY